MKDSMFSALHVTLPILDHILLEYNVLYPTCSTTLYGCNASDACDIIDTAHLTPSNHRGPVTIAPLAVGDRALPPAPAHNCWAYHLLVMYVAAASQVKCGLCVSLQHCNHKHDVFIHLHQRKFKYDLCIYVCSNAITSVGYAISSAPMQVLI